MSEAKYGPTVFSSGIDSAGFNPLQAGEIVVEGPELAVRG